jgi:hypothetical protein
MKHNNSISKGAFIIPPKYGAAISIMANNPVSFVLHKRA